MNDFGRRLAALIGLAALGAAFTPAPDLDVQVPTGSPFDSIKIRKDTPTGTKRGDITTAGSPRRPASEEPAAGLTVAEEPGKVPPPKPPAALPGIKEPYTRDYQEHLRWIPKDERVDYLDPKATPRPSVATGVPAPPPAVEPEKWDMKAFPPDVPNALYVYAVTRYLMVLLHPAMVSERELTQSLIEVGYPAHYAATATRHEPPLKMMAQIVMEAVGPQTANPPARPQGELAQKVYMDLLAHYAYEPEFGQWILSQPSGETLPVLLEIVKKQHHPFLLRNAVFLLRCYNQPEVVPALRDCLMKSSDKVVRNRALAALVRWRDEEIVPWLIEKAGGRDVSFRSYALWALGRIGAPSAIEPVLQLTRTSAADPEFLWAAIPALCWMGDGAQEEMKKKIRDRMKGLLENVLPKIPEPPRSPWLQTNPGAQVITPEPPQALQKILVQRVRFTLARMGSAADQEWVKQLKEDEIVIPNKDFHQETLQRIR